ncbi:hypothetical protein ACVMIH_002354 [Bradyrhizobium sp. USDA 4503]
MSSNINRGQFLTGLDPTQKGPPEKLLKELRTKLENNPAFQALPQAKKKNLLSGKDMFVTGRHQEMLAFGWGDATTGGIYKYLSSHAHSMGLAFTRTGVNRIFANDSGAPRATAGFALEFASSALGVGCLHMVKLFPYIEAAFDPLVFGSMKSTYTPSP